MQHRCIYALCVNRDKSQLYKRISLAVYKEHEQHAARLQEGKPIPFHTNSPVSPSAPAANFAGFTPQHCFLPVYMAANNPFCYLVLSYEENMHFMHLFCHAVTLLEE